MDPAALEPAPPERVKVRADARKDRILEDSLVLSSQRIRHWIEFDGERFLLTLDGADAPRALEALRQYEQENRAFDAEEDPAFHLHLSPLLHLAIPASVFFWTASVPWEAWITRRGGADAALIRDGELWRVLTATTLHADSEHFLGNMLSGFFILNLLRRRCGPGTPMVLLTLAAAITNFAVAALSPDGYFSVGFSTVVFAGLGMLAGVEAAAAPREARGGWRRATPLLAAFFLAVMTGLGERADVKAHFIGFAAGILLAPAAAWMSRARTGEPAWQAAGVAATWAVYAVAWARALA